MVQGVGGTGSSGSISNISAYQTYYPMYQQYCQNNNSNIDFEAWLIMKGYIANFNQQVENYLETGDAQRGDDSKDSMNFNTHVSNSTGALYQSVDDDCYYEFNWEDGTYTKMTDKQQVANALGMPEDANYDVIKLGYMSAEVIDYTFGNLDDGQDSTTKTLYGNYGNSVYTQKEFDVHYIINALLADPSDPQYEIAKNIFDELCENLDQWMPASDQAELDQIALEYGNNSGEYRAKLQEIILKNLDQANEWVEEHTHVKKPTGTIGTENADGTTGAEGTTGTGEGAESETGTVPDYDKTDVLAAAGLSTAYSRGDVRHAESTDNSEGNRRKELEAQMDQDLNTIANALISELGDQMTDEMQTYINKAIAATAADESLIRTWSEKHGFLNMHKKTLAEYNIKDVADRFFEEFNTMCANNGKTTAEVEAERKAAEEKAAKEKSTYQTIFGLDMKTTAKDEGVKVDSNLELNVSAYNSASDIQEKVKSEILTPLINKLVTQYAGNGVDASQLQTEFENAATAALSDTEAWGTMQGNYYIINTNKVIELFEDNVKQIINNKGYNF